MSEPKAYDFVHCGRRPGVGGALVDEIRQIMEDGTLGPARCYKAVRNQRVLGGIYTGALFNEQNQCVGYTGARYTGKQWGREHPDEVIEWEAKDSQARHDAKQKALEKDAAKCSLIDESLDQLRVLYAAMKKRGDYEGMHALETAVIESLRRSK